VENLTTSEIERLIAHKLAEEEYLLDAHVSVMVTGYNSKRFLVLGAVEKPGSYSLKARERILNAISRAGGVRRTREYYSERAGKKGMIIRTEDPDTDQESKIVINLDLDGLLKGRDQISNIFMADKDVLFIPTAEHFNIIGQVKNPGSYAIPEREIALVEAISMAGGFTRIAARNRTRIIRVEDGVEKIIEVKMDAITKAGKKIQDVPIKPGDVIVVPESFF
jgi:polysaccharide export outer membrane protein